MRLKLFFFPTALLVTVVMFIWYIYPLWMGNDGIRDKRIQLKKVENDLQVFRQKKQSLARAIEIMDDNNDSVNFAFKYIPTSRKNNLIINALSKVANSSGLLISSINIVEDNTLDQQDNKDNLDNKDKFGVPKLKDCLAEVNLIGNYDQIRGFLASLYHLNMMNEVQDINITAAKTENGSDQNLLEVGSQISFKYLPEINLTQSGEQKFMNEFNFSENYFDFLTINNFKAKNNIPAGGGDLEEGITGQTNNPFVIQANSSNAETENNEVKSNNENG